MDAFAANDKAAAEAQARWERENGVGGSGQQSARQSTNFQCTESARRMTEYNTLQSQGRRTIDAAISALMTAINAMIGLEVNERMQRLGQELIDAEQEKLGVKEIKPKK